MKTPLKIFASTALISLMSMAGPAIAAGPTPVFVAPTVVPPPATSYDWTGPYAGVTVGHGWSQANHCDGGANCISGAANQPDTDPQGFVFGIMAGYNFHLQGPFVLGVEADFSMGDQEGTFPSTPAFACGAGCRTEIDHFVTARVRLGYALDRTLPYLTAGVANTKYSASHSGGAFSGDGRITQAVFGAGVEHMLDNGWSLRGEAIHFWDPQNDDTIVYDATGCGAPGCSLIDFTHSVVRIGVAKKF